jgi:hypothetical protein
MSDKKGSLRIGKNALRMLAIGLSIICIWNVALSTFVKGAPMGQWVRYQYQVTIPVGNGYYHQHVDQGAIAADAYIVSSTGKAGLTYKWQQPWLYVSIVNQDTKSITVTWVEEFYEV